MSLRAVVATVWLAAALIGVPAEAAHGQVGYEGSPECDPAPFHTIRLPLEVPGYVVACMNADGTSAHLRNVSANVLRLRPRDGYAAPSIRRVDDLADAPGVVAAQKAVRSGWDEVDGTFVLSLGESAIVSADGPVGVEWYPDAALTRMANIARWAAGRLTQIAEEQQRFLPTRFHARVASCAAAGERLAAGSPTLGDALSIGMSARSCKTLFGDVIGTAQETEVQRIRRDILHVAKPVAMEAVAARVLRVLAG